MNKRPVNEQQIAAAYRHADRGREFCAELYAANPRRSLTLAQRSSLSAAFTAFSEAANALDLFARTRWSASPYAAVVQRDERRKAK